MTGSTSTLVDRARSTHFLSTPSAPVLILLVLALLAGVFVFAVSAPSAVPSVASDLLQTANVMDQHADTMTADGQRLADQARAVTGADRDLWVATAKHMVSDGTSLRAMAQRLRASAGVLGDEPTYRANANPVSLAAQAALLRADGQAAVDHGRLMVDQAAFMAALASRPGSGITEQDASLMATDATRIIDAGERTLALASRLDADADQLRRGLGR
ncbi:MAG: hypothetical protein M3P16_00800 [Chloroflexota bacterium]|nr:hypothetical protein [Chloroflexota bacterium]